MPLSLNTSKRRLPRSLAPWVAAAVPILLGSALLYWQAGQALRQAAHHTDVEALTQFELILDNVSAAATEILPLAGQPCAQAQLTLRDQVTRRPFVRSTNLIADGSLYCSSLFGAFSEPVNPGDYVDGTLWLMAGNPVTPDRGLLIYRATEGDNGALSTVDGYHLANALRMIGASNEVRLQVGEAWLGADGKVHDGQAPTFALAHTPLASARYPFSVSSGFPKGARWDLMIAQYMPLFGLLLFLGVIAGLTCHWFMGQVQSRLQELQRALDAEEFVPFFQPIVHSRDNDWAGVEVLMRWEHPREGLVRPDLFIPYAEDCGLIVPMTRLLMRKTVQHLQECGDDLPNGFHVGFNITAQHCQEPQLLEDCRAFLAAFAPGQVALTLELTERELVKPTEQTHRLFEQLHEMGVTIAIDDFGTGQSSLSYLQQFKVDFLKIDQSFVALIGANALSGHILDSIIELSAKLDLQVVAEGVETEEQRAYLVAKDVEYLQGYLLARPMPGNEFQQRLQGLAR